MQNSDNGFSEFSNAHLEVTFPTVSIYIININNSWIAASSFLNITCQRNVTPLHGKQIVICIILGRKKIRNMCQNAFLPCLQGNRMRRSKREKQKTDV